ncbi:1-aminocyclopropane-1-carboxylate oxidase homolog 1 [Striga hermonthica]|uniref:1-aminocyclopropane-1-carboxylate oxidase homolog 1 n=1 Tax=Striga hermonthica TaxID=68872 RepID=A0A9N7MY85_STRHE|nr:1-aminocyclopropane-1-carboxylate oxidase homolog 1 [Striga hermonthica]
MNNMSSLNQTLPESTQDQARLSELKAFEETKTGVKGLIDSGIQTVPGIFIRPPDELADEKNHIQSNLQVPVIDLSGVNEDACAREKIVGEVKRASSEWGFFQLVNHGISREVLDNMLDGIRKFHEQDGEVKKEFNTRDMTRRVRFGSNVDLYRSRAANWRDSLTISVPNFASVEPDELPEICRDSTMKYLVQVGKLGETLFELLSEALGLKPNHLRALECGKNGTFIGHYYPACPQPDITIGTSKHTDPSFLTILLQDQIGGLQVLHQDQYINVQPLPGALVVNIGDMLQIISNDEFVSPDHRVLANRVGPRISVAGFFTGDALSGRIYGPIKELISEDNCPRYKEFTARDYIAKFFMRPIDKSGLDEFKLEEQFFDL